MKTKLAMFIFLFVTYFAISLSAQMPNWHFYIDREGNKYFFDNNGKIFTPHKPLFIYKTVRLAGLDFYLNHAQELFRFHRVRSITILKSIMALPVDNNRVLTAKAKAASILNAYRKGEQSRYNADSKSASIIYYHHENKDYIINDYMKYAVALDYPSYIIRKRDRSANQYYYSSLLVGLNKVEIRNKPGKTWSINSSEINKIKSRSYDILLAIDSEKYREKIKNINQLETNWRSILGYDTFKRKEVLRNNKRIIYEIKNQNPDIFGYEAFLLNKKYGHIIRIISNKQNENKYNTKMFVIISNIEVTN